MSTIDTVLFDLDGTLVDTAPDMANALNQLLREEGRKEMAYEDIRPVVSNGSVALVKLGFGEDQEDHYLKYLKQRYLEIYQQALYIDSCLFDGMETLLDYIEAHHLKWGVVTNKPSWLTEPLLEQMGLSQRSACIVSGDTTANRKPHPEPMYFACKQAGSQPQHCIYVGDARRDIEAGRNAGMKTLVAEYGYIGDWENINEWNADAHIQHPEDIIKILNT